MAITTRRATYEDLEKMLEIEESAIPGYGYLYENRHFYFDGIENQGEMILALHDNEPIGMGQYSILPDGSGWLEILRVEKKSQHMGAGRAIYKRYMELAEETNAPSVAMFTGRKNVASKSLAEKNGFSLAAAYIGYDLLLSDENVKKAKEFRLITDAKEAEKLITKNQPQWGKFMALNRTFFHYGTPLYEYLTKRNMVYANADSVIVLGCRMLEHRGWHIGFMDGNLEECLKFASSMTKEKGLPKLTIMFPPERADLIKLVEDYGYKASGELIVMERKMK